MIIGQRWQNPHRKYAPQKASFLENKDKKNQINRENDKTHQ